MTSSTSAEETKEIITALLTSNPLSCTVSQLCNDFLRTVGYKIPFKPLGFGNIIEYLRSIPDTLIVHGDGYYAEIEGVIKPKSAHIGEMVSKQKTFKIPPHKRKYLKGHRQFPSHQLDKSKFQPDYPSDESSDSQTVENKDCNENPWRKNEEIEKIAPKISPSVLSNLKKDKLLEEKFLEVLKVCSESHGYKSVNEICEDIPQVFNKTAPQNKSQPQKCLSIVPPNVFRLGDEIRRYSVDDIEIGECIYIGMGQIYDVSKFWIFFENGQLQTLMKDLQSYFCNPDNRFLVPEAMLQENLFCVCLYGEEYHRAMIVGVANTPPGFVRVLFVDYGTVEDVCTSKIWLLPKQFGEVSCQLVRARLANVCPPYENFPWSYKSTQRFQELTNNASVLNAEVAKVLKEELCLEIYLGDFSDENNISYISDTLVREGLAVYTEKKRKTYLLDPKPKVADLHLLPEFHEIEAGKAPTPTEMENFIKNKVPMHHYLPQYFDITLNEDYDEIERDYEEMVTSATDFKIDVTEIENDFDFSVFPSEIGDEILQFAKRYIPSMLIASNTPKTSGEANGSPAPSSVKTSCDEEVPLSISSIEELSLSESDLSVFESSSKNKSTNPFLNEDIVHELNLPRCTNPFLNNNLEETVNTSAVLDLFSKPLEDREDNNLTNLTTPCLGASQPCKDEPCRCADERELDNSISTNPFLNNDNNEMVTRRSSNPFLNPNMEAVESSPRVRPPPGFSLENLLQPVVPFSDLNQMFYQNYCTNPNYFPLINPYYQRCMMPPMNFVMLPGAYFAPQFHLQYVQRAQTPELTPKPSEQLQKN